MYAFLNSVVLRVLCVSVGVLFLPQSVSASGGVDTPDAFVDLPLATGGNVGINLAPTGMNTPPNTIVYGNVGIGTETPTTKLDVNGGIKPGNITRSDSCSPEGAWGYDSSAHVPVFCNNQGAWQAVGGSTPSINYGACQYYTWKELYGYCPTDYFIVGALTRNSDSGEWNGFYCCPLK